MACSAYICGNAYEQTVGDTKLDGMTGGKLASTQTCPARPLAQCHRHISNVQVLRCEVSKSTSVSVLIEGCSRGLVAKAWGTAIFSEFQDQDAAYLEAHDRASAILKELLQPETVTEAPEDWSPRQSFFASCPEVFPRRPMTNAELPMRRSSSEGNGPLPDSGMRRKTATRAERSHQAPHVTEHADEASYNIPVSKMEIKQQASTKTLRGLIRQLRTCPETRARDYSSSISNDDAVRPEDSRRIAMPGAPVMTRRLCRRYTASY